MTLAFFEETGEQLGGEVAMIAFANNLRDEAASDCLALEYYS